MVRKLLILLTALLLAASAFAESYEGVTVALSTLSVTAERGGRVALVAAQAGSRVASGDTLIEYAPERAFAEQDGTVSLIYADEGETVDGTLLELMPLERYLIHCTVSKARQTAEATLVHEGEQVYIRCTSDGSHRAIGVLSQVDGQEYRVLTTAGRLYVGETVYLYRDADFSSEQRVGIGTVVENDTQSYDASGTLTRLCVTEGDDVERGQLLFELNGGSTETPVSGILTAVSVEPGSSVQEGQIVASIVPDGQVAVSFEVEEAEIGLFHIGQTVQLTPVWKDGEDSFPGTVLDCAWVAENGKYTVRVQPQDGVELPLGLSVTVRTGTETVCI